MKSWKNGGEIRMPYAEKPVQKELIQELYKNRMILTWYRDEPEGWELVSGLWTPFYINLRKLPSYPELFKKSCKELGKFVASSNVNRIIGIATAGIPIAAGIGYEYGIPVGYTRKLEGVRRPEDLERKISEYGAHRLVEGVMEDGDKLGLVDDLITTAGSKLVARAQVLYEAEKRRVEIECNKVFVVVDREQGGREALEEQGIELYALIPFKQSLRYLEGYMDEVEFAVIKDYLNNPEKYQSIEIQEKLKKMAKKKRKVL